MMPNVGTISFGGLATGLDTKTLISHEMPPENWATSWVRVLSSRGGPS
jgi:hypothetical protein